MWSGEGQGGFDLITEHLLRQHRYVLMAHFPLEFPHATADNPMACV